MDMKYLDTFGKRLEFLLELKDIQKKQLAEVLNVSVAYLMGWEEVQKKNDTLTDIVVRLRSDDEFADLMKGISQLDQVQLASVKQVVDAFLSMKG